MEGTALLLLPQGLRITTIERQETGLLMQVLSTQRTCQCPLCGAESDAVHSRYQRWVSDLPCVGQPIRLRLSVRKFFCYNPHCARKIFTERLPTFVEPWAQMTVRLKDALAALGLSTSGSLGTRLSARLGIVTSWMTILRRIMELPQAPAAAVTALGIDDFSFKRGRTFGTILVDLSAHQVIDLLPERTTERAATWMREHPSVRYVSRDRGQDYATACREGAPQATAVADRFHIMKNFVEALEAEVSRCYRHLRQTHSPLPAPDLPTPEEWRQVPDADVVRKRRARQASKQERFEQAKDLFSQGVAVKEIAEQLGISLRTVYRWLDREECPAHQPEPKEHTERLERFEQAKALRLHGLSQQEIARRLAIGVRTVQRWQARETYPYSLPRYKRRSIFDPYAAYVLSRWQQGERSVSLLWQEIQSQGFSGSIQTLYRFVRALRQDAGSLPAPGVADRVSVQKVTWLIARPYERLKAEERTDLQALCQESQELATLHRLAQSFGQIVRKREGHRLGDWMRQVKESHFRDVKRFAAGLQRDQEAILSGLTLVYSNGMTEGFVNKLKLIKRQGYGRAGFPLLRQRVLHAL